MALSQANLTVGVGIDTSKFIADSAIIKNELRGIKREVDAAAKAGDVGRLQAASAQQAQLTRQYAELARAARGATDAHKEAIPVFAQLGGAFTVLRTGAAAVTSAIALVATGFVKLADSAAKSVDAIEDVAAAAGITSKQLLAMQLAGAAVGSTAEDVNAGLLRSTRAIGEARKQAAQFDQTNKELRLGLNVLGTEIKPVTAAVTDYSNSFTQLGLDVRSFAPTAEGNRALLQAAAFALDGITDASERAQIAQGIFGKNWSKQIENLKAGKDGYAEAAKAVDAYGIAISETESKNAAAWLKSSDTFSTVFGRMKDVLGNAIGGALAPTIDQLTTSISGNAEGWTRLGEAIGVSMGQIITVVTTGGKLAADGLWWIGWGITQLIDGAKVAADAFVSAWDGAFKWFGGAVNTVIEWFDWLIAKAKEAWNWIGQAASGATGSGSAAAVSPSGAASGGYIRGPGTGTSDSIFARLSNGEYVINAASVRRLGTGFLHSLNSFAQGGLVGMPPLRFAEGGLAAAGGTPVHLHLGGQSFALSGSQPVVSALVSEAHSQQMKSSGVKPTWYAGRSGGR